MRPDTLDYQQRLQETVDFLDRELGTAPALAMILGSGLGDFVEAINDRQVLSYSDIPSFPMSAVVGHLGQLSYAKWKGVGFCALQGRVHFYEGYPMAEIVFPVRSLALWGVKEFVITNAAGAVNSRLSPGDLMLLSDHINLLGENPLTGENLSHLGPRFPDMTIAYDPVWRTRARQCARQLGFSLREGVYGAVKGPCYETPAEIRMLRILGADAVGMSTVPEVIALNHMSRRVLGISCITNMAAGMRNEKIDHEEVLEVGRRVKRRFAQLLTRLLEPDGYDKRTD